MEDFTNKETNRAKHPGQDPLIPLVLLPGHRPPTHLRLISEWLNCLLLSSDHSDLNGDQLTRTAGPQISHALKGKQSLEVE